ncbi:hypothetical protein L3Q72_13040 [Vibrio sp. JC009]|uniref:hypothetical protein n=1 Tax=Vibrio sp. JC009 TaxID=2912314 RepID=UPI0023AF3EE9|nr:hypothetical protein [Vibrio sp. JC009]WED21539.1 hypothetical protein L3Q72_13040 [Vibrio sp. JC009]
MSHKQPKRIRKQRGNMILIAVFVIVVMGMLAANLTRIRWSNQDTLTREYLGTQAWFLAHSGNEWALTVLFPLGNDQEDPDDLLPRCRDTINGTTGEDALAALISQAGLSCEATVTCTYPPVDSTDPNTLDDTIPDELQFYKVTTVAICGSSGFQVQREQEVWARGVKE